MIPADIAFAMLVNKTTQAYLSNAPTYMTYREFSHVTVQPALKKPEDINRSVIVRVADDAAIMRDLPNGGESTGEAWPIIPYFDPLSNFGYSWHAGLKHIDITLNRGNPLTFAIPAQDPTVDIDTPYMTYWVPHYAPDSTDANPHFLFDQTTRFNGYYPTEIMVDPTSGLPSHIGFVYAGEQVGLDYSVIDGHWVITRGSYTAIAHAFGFTFTATGEVTFDQIAFPATAPDARLSGTPTPSPSPSPSS